MQEQCRSNLRHDSLLFSVLGHDEEEGLSCKGTLEVLAEFWDEVQCDCEKGLEVDVGWNISGTPLWRRSTSVCKQYSSEELLDYTGFPESLL